MSSRAARHCEVDDPPERSDWRRGDLVSPSESQLRAALQHGEGDAPDPSALIAHAVGVRRDRRRRITSIAGGVAVVAVIGVGLTAAITSGSGSHHAASSADKAAATHGSAAAAAGGVAESAAASMGNADAAPARSSSAAVPAPYVAPRRSMAASLAGAMAALHCPATPARYMLPGGGGSGQFGSGDPLFPDSMVAMKVCTYPARTGAHMTAKVYGQPEASQIAAALDAAPDTRSSTSCPANTDYVGGQIEILAVDAQGRALKPVVLTLGCVTSQATNGTAVRYVTAIPDPLLSGLVMGAEPNPPGRTMAPGSSTP
jgi:hypothetical protein